MLALWINGLASPDAHERLFSREFETEFDLFVFVIVGIGVPAFAAFQIALVLLRGQPGVELGGCVSRTYDDETGRIGAGPKHKIEFFADE
jgi:hypothetical protein